MVGYHAHTPLCNTLYEGIPFLGTQKLSHVIAFDVETTGLDPVADRVVELAFAGLNTDGQIAWTWNQLFNRGCEIPSQATAIHGIENDDVKYAPAFAEKVAEIEQLLTDRTLLAHNLFFDVGFLGVEMRRCGARLPVNRGLDTLKISRRVDPNARSHNLSSVCRRYRIGLGNAHRAAADTVAVAQLFVAMKSFHGQQKGVFEPTNLIETPLI